MNATEMIEKLMASISARIDASVDPLNQEIASLKSQLAEFEAPQPVEPVAGKSAYDLAVDNGFDGDEKAWLESLRGVSGSDGASGKDGESVSDEAVRGIVSELLEAAVKELPQPKDGADGADGKDGESVDIEAVKALVSESVTALANTIPLPSNGKDGAPGLDALQIEILPSIDVARNYARGTYASYNGGIVRAARTTDPLNTLSDEESIETKGWHVVLNGMGDVQVERVDDREYSIKCVTTNGQKVEKSVTFPMMIYRGVYRPGEHEPGDTVTRAGSLWHCDEATTDAPGDAKAKGWTLATKRGRDGKDGRDGIDKTKAVSIQDDGK